MNRNATNTLWFIVLGALIFVTISSASVNVIAGTGALFIGTSLVAAACIIQDAIEGRS